MPGSRGTQTYWTSSQMTIPILHTFCSRNACYISDVVNGQEGEKRHVNSVESVNLQSERFKEAITYPNAMTRTYKPTHADIYPLSRTRPNRESKFMFCTTVVFKAAARNPIDVWLVAWTDQRRQDLPNYDLVDISHIWKMGFHFFLLLHSQ